MAINEWLSLVLVLKLTAGHDIFPGQMWTSDFAVEMGLDENEADLYVGTHGFQIIRKIEALDNVYHLFHAGVCTNSGRCKRHAENLVELLKKHPMVKRVEQQYALEFDKRFVLRDFESDIDSVLGDFKNEQPKYSQEDSDYEERVHKRSQTFRFLRFNDPAEKMLWYIHNDGHTYGIKPGLDLNALTAFRKGVMGQGSVVTVVDDGVDTEHPELKTNYDPAASADLNDPSDLEGNPRGPSKILPPEEAHGTSCAAEIAGQANNGICGFGVAPKASLGGIRMLAGTVTDLLEAYALTHNNQYIQIYSNSWGPKDSGSHTQVPGRYTSMALEAGVTKGRGGKGSLFVFASGNGGHAKDSCGADGFVNSPYTIAATAVNIEGLSPVYTEMCSAVSVAVPVGGYHHYTDAYKQKPNPKVTTASINGGCTDKFVGTSAATPLVAGCIALALQVNPALTWRDVQHLFPYCARVPNRLELVWQRNGAGHLVSHRFGFGLLDCGRLVYAAQRWTNVGPQHKCVAINKIGLRLPIRAHSRSRIHIKTNACANQPGHRVDALEHVLVTVQLNHSTRGDLAIWLTSPAGTRSPLLLHRPKDMTNKPLNFTYLTLMTWGENPVGDWLLEFVDRGKRGPLRTSGSQRGVVESVRMELWGTTLNSSGASLNGQNLGGTLRRGTGGSANTGRAHTLTETELGREFERQRNLFLNSVPEHVQVSSLRHIMSTGNLTVPDPKWMTDFLKLKGQNSLDLEDLETVDKLLTKSPAYSGSTS